ncbi:MAG: DEAD/DEAH box helicase [Chloroflexota bacterium]
MCQALDEEVQELRRLGGGRRLGLQHGRLVGTSGSSTLYAFERDSSLAVPDDTPAKLEMVPHGRAEPVVLAVQVVSSAGFELVLACPSRLPDPLPAAMLLLDTAFLLEALAERLADLQPADARLAMRLFGLAAPARRRRPDRGALLAPAEVYEGANAYQREAVQASLQRDVTYVWGPPGTGKTTTLALIAQALAGQGLRLLVTATTNVAVDNAILAIAHRLGDDAEGGRLVRFGPPQVAALRERPLLQLDGLIEAALHPDETAPPSSRPGAEASEGAQLKQALRERILIEATVVGATLARLPLAPELWWQAFDGVLIDEASAAALPAVFFAASLAGRKVIALGDPKQLPPIALSSGEAAAHWLRRDVFTQAGLADDDERAVLLREQYRMHPRIARLANTLVYGGRLEDAPDVRARGSRQPALRLLDTSAEDGVCERPAAGSRQNALHAALAVQVALEMLSTAARADPGWEERRAVGIVTPYAAQARLIWKLLREAKIEHAVDVGTVHRFQGLEREAIIFDTVESPPYLPAPFVRGGPGSESMRLINVAITRARSRLAVIANVTYLRQTLPRHATLLGLLALLEDG